MSKKFTNYRYILISICLASVYWMIETSFDYFILGGGFWNNLIYISLHEIWMRLIIITVIISFGIYAQSRFIKIKNAERRIKKLYSLLKSIRNINQLIVQETNLKRLLDRSVKILVETRGYLDAYIAIKVNKDMKFISHSGGHEREDLSFDLRDDDKPSCISEILNSKEIKIIENPEEYCSDCDFCTHEEDHKTVLVPMTNDEKISGILGTCIRKTIELDREEISLLKEVTDDLAFAIDKFRIKKEKEISEKKKEFLNTILRQDIRSKSQLATGYLQLLQEESGLEGEKNDYLKSALSSTQNIIDLIEDVNHLREIEDLKDVDKKDIIHVIDEVIDDLSDEDIKIIKDTDISSLSVLGDYSLKYLLKNVIYLRKKDNPDLKEFHLNLNKKKDEVIINITDDGPDISDALIKGLSGHRYTGETAGIEGSRYYIIKELIKHNKGKINITESKTGSARFDITLKRP